MYTMTTYTLVDVHQADVRARTHRTPKHGGRYCMDGPPAHVGPRRTTSPPTTARLDSTAFKNQESSREEWTVSVDRFHPGMGFVVGLAPASSLTKGGSIVTGLFVPVSTAVVPVDENPITPPIDHAPPPA